MTDRTNKLSGYQQPGSANQLCNNKSIHDATADTTETIVFKSLTLDNLWHCLEAIPKRIPIFSLQAG